MGAKDWMLLYADRDIRAILRSEPPIDRPATRELVERLYPDRLVVGIEDGTLMEDPNPPDYHVYAGCFPDLTVVCSGDVALDRPSALHRQFLDVAAGRTTYLHAMHSAVDWFAYAIWSGDGSLQRALSVSPDHGIMENLGTPLAFEAPYWAGERPIEADEDLPLPYPLPFHPLEMAETALRALFGFNYEGWQHDDDPDLAEIVLAGFTVYPT